VVGFFYPILMFLLLSIFPLARLLPREGADESVLDELVAGRLPLPAWIAAGLFSFLQIVPYLYPGDTAITGEGRLYALHMFDARVECEAIGTLHLADGSVEGIDLHVGSTRNGCDPIRIRAHARILCQRRDSGTVAFESLDVDLRSRRATDRELTPVMHIQDFCANLPRYSPFLHNEWILVP